MRDDRNPFTTCGEIDFTPRQATLLIAACVGIVAGIGGAFIYAGLQLARLLGGAS